MDRVTLKTLTDSRHFIKDFCEDCRLRGMTGESIRRYRSSLKIFIQFLENKGLSITDVNIYALRDFLQHLMNERGAKHKTVENYFSALSAFYDFLAFEGYVASNIVLPFRKRHLKRYARA